MTTYEYSQLQENSFFRILELQAGTAGTPLKGRLIISSLDDQPKFEALSYAWGRPILNSSISCSGQRIGVTENCHSALQRLRCSDRSRVLWVDAICINQDSKLEKSQQVPLMGRIYSQAERALIWFGEEADESDRAMELLLLLKDLRLRHEREIMLQMMRQEFLGKKENQSNFESQLEDSEPGKLTSHGFSLHACEEREGVPPYDLSKWEPLIMFFDRSWFSRVWVLQEVVLAKQALVHCGSKVLEWDHLGFAMECMLRTLRVSVVTNFENPQYMHLLRKAISEEGEIYLLQALRTAQCFSCSNPEDRVYGVLGFVDWQFRDRLKVDYSLSVEEIYHSLAVVYLKDGLRGLRLLACAQQPRNLSALPSWVPDWTSGLPDQDLTKVSWYCASGCGTEGYVPPAFNADNTVLTLSVLRLKCNKIAELAASMPLKSEDRASPVEYLRFKVYLEWQVLAFSRLAPPYSRYGQTDREEFWRTLLFDVSEDRSKRADPSMASSYTHFYNNLLEIQWGLYNELWPDLDQHRRTAALMILLDDTPEFHKFHRATQHVIGYRFGLLGRSNWYCLVPEPSKVGDSICVIKVLDVPFVIRQEMTSNKEDSTHWTIVRPCYVHGITDAGLARTTEVEKQFEMISFK
jgi:hypothetical protein